VASVKAADLQEVIVVTSYMMAFLNLRELMNSLQEFHSMLWTLQSNSNKGGHPAAYGFRVNQCCVAFDNTTLFQAANPISASWSRQV